MDKDFRSLLRWSPARGNATSFYPLEIPPYQLSIQAGKYRYSTPNEWRPSAYDYRDMEVAIIKNDEFLDPQAEGWTYAWVGYFDTTPGFTDKGEGKPMALAGYVPIEQIQSIFEDLRTLSMVRRPQPARRSPRPGRAAGSG